MHEHCRVITSVFEFYRMWRETIKWANVRRYGFPAMFFIEYITNSKWSYVEGLWKYNCLNYKLGLIRVIWKYDNVSGVYNLIKHLKRNNNFSTRLMANTMASSNNRSAIKRAEFNSSEQKINWFLTFFCFWKIWERIRFQRC